jgi:SM-20-related protein
VKVTDTGFTDAQFEAIAQALAQDGYYVGSKVLPVDLVEALLKEVRETQKTRLKRAGVGRGVDFHIDDSVRGDSIMWIEGSTPAQASWLALMQGLQSYLNRRLYLGLHSYESHYACYAPGAHYEKHKDAFLGQANRILSTVAYLNPAWQSDWGGQLVLYDDANEELGRVEPEAATMIIFLSEEFPHEVLAAKQERYSIAGWYRLNASSSKVVDPDS